MPSITNAKARVEAVGSADTPVDAATLQRVLGRRATVTMCQWPSQLRRDVDDAKVAEVVGNCEAIVLRQGWLPAVAFGALRDLLVVVSHGTGVDAIDVTAATENGVLVFNVPGGNTTAVVEHVIGLTIALLRHVVSSAVSLGQGIGWEASRSVGTEILGKTVGIVGYGATGRQVAAIFRLIGANVIVTTRSSPPTGEYNGVRFVPLDELLRTSDIVSLHVPLNPSTRNLLDARHLSFMKSEAVLINVSRGAVVDEMALLEGLRAGRIGGAALDVFSVEPPPNLGMFLALKNVIVTPHLAGATRESLERIARGAAERIALALDGVVAESCLNPQATTSTSWIARLERWRARKD